MHPVKSSSNHTDPISNHNKDLDQIHVHAIPSKNSEIPKTTIPPTQNVNKTPQNPSPKIDNKNSANKEQSDPHDFFPQSNQNDRFKAMENAIMEEFQDVISDCLKHKRMSGAPAEITFKEGVSIKPLHINIARPLPIHMKREADMTLNKYIKEGIIEPVNYPTTWLSPAFWVAKGDKKSVRLVTDYKEINKYIERNVHPFASAADCIKQIPDGTKYFCSADCLSGYYQVPLSSSASDLTTFLLPNGKFRYLSCPMGLANSSDEFLLRSDAALANCKEFCIKLVDDLLIHAKTEKELMQRIRKVLEALREHKITLSKKKFKISNKVKFAGMVLSDTGIKPDPERITALTNLDHPKNLKEVRGWLGAIQQLNIYHPNLASFLKPVQNLTKKDSVWNWTPECDKSYTEINKLLKEHLELKYYNPQKPAILMTDASFSGFGFVLVQTAKYDSKNQPIKFDLIMAGSRSLKDVETRYSVSEIEAVALNWSLNKCSHFLKGAPKTEVWVDHKPLIGLHKKGLATMTTRLQRIFEKLNDFEFELKYVKGASHFLPDYLSRKPTDIPDKNDTVFCRVIDSYSPQSPEHDLEGGYDKPFKFLIELANKDTNYKIMRTKLTSRELPSKDDSPEIKSFLPVWNNLSVSGNLILYDDKIIIPENGRQWILKELHSGHQGTIKTLALGRVRYFWPTMSKDIKNLCQSCTHCIKYLPSQQKEPMIATLASRPFEMLSTDVFECAQKKFLIIVDRFSSFPFVIPITRETSKSIVSKFEQLFLDLCFTPDVIRSDSATNYLGGVFQTFCDEWGIIHEPSSPHHKISNGHAESNVKKVKKLLEIHSGVFSKAFRKGLNLLRSTPLTDLSRKQGCEGPSPVQLLYGRQTRLPNLPSPKHCFMPIDWEVASEYKKQTTQIRRHYYDQNARSLSQLQPNQRVVIQDPISKRWTTFGEILKVQDTKRSYLVQCDNGRILDRNRRLLRPLSPI